MIHNANEANLSPSLKVLKGYVHIIHSVEKVSVLGLEQSQSRGGHPSGPGKWRKSYREWEKRKKASFPISASAPKTHRREAPLGPRVGPASSSHRIETPATPLLQVQGLGPSLEERTVQTSQRPGRASPRTALLPSAVSPHASSWEQRGGSRGDPRGLEGGSQDLPVITFYAILNPLVNVPTKHYGKEKAFKVTPPPSSPFPLPPAGLHQLGPLPSPRSNSRPLSFHRPLASATPRAGKFGEGGASSSLPQRLPLGLKLFLSRDAEMLSALPPWLGPGTGRT
ncbi:uncharacterized protein LOC130456919 [Monodelphis domestica]|uniref:uncharacterized protein LOC130456919 n=1 Tax=Monodelphis domestica TaxID=13616 RepID=UPI0024E1BD00|nr:uncharacterized protein LOC130456919 [Monodelphis domestica]